MKNFGKDVSQSNLPADAKLAILQQRKDAKEQDVQNGRGGGRNGGSGVGAHGPLSSRREKAGDTSAPNRAKAAGQGYPRYAGITNVVLIYATP